MKQQEQQQIIIEKEFQCLIAARAISIYAWNIMDTWIGRKFLKNGNITQTQIYTKSLEKLEAKCSIANSFFFFQFFKSSKSAEMPELERNQQTLPNSIQRQRGKENARE